MKDLDQFTPAQQEQLYALMRQHDAQNAEIKTTASAPSHGCLIGRVGRCSAWLVNYGFGALSVLLLQSDLEQVNKDWMPTVISAGESLVSCLDDHSHRTANPNQQFPALPSPQPIDAIGSGYAEIGFKASGVGIAATTTTPSPQETSGGLFRWEGNAFVSVGASGTLT